MKDPVSVNQTLADVQAARERLNQFGWTAGTFMISPESNRDPGACCVAGALVVSIAPEKGRLELGDPDDTFGYSDRDTPEWRRYNAAMHAIYECLLARGAINAPYDDDFVPDRITEWNDMQNKPDRGREVVLAVLDETAGALAARVAADGTS